MSESKPAEGLFPGQSRRNFLKGAAAVGAVAAAIPLIHSELSPLEADQGGGDAPPAPKPVTLSLTINGLAREVAVEPQATLLDVLRWKLGITGPKEICDRGSCSGCTVLVDGRPMNSCMLFAMEMPGRGITTIEGLGTPDAPGVVQQAFVEVDALQCGYCTPGMVMSVHACLSQDRQASREALSQAVCGNLCRCGTYNRVVEAAQIAQKRWPT